MSLNAASLHTGRSCKVPSRVTMPWLRFGLVEAVGRTAGLSHGHPKSLTLTAATVEDGEHSGISADCNAMRWLRLILSLPRY